MKDKKLFSTYVSENDISSFAPTKMVVRVDNKLTFPKLGAVSRLAMRGVGDSSFCKKACPSTLVTLSSACSRIANRLDIASEFPGLFDELSRYGHFGYCTEIVSQASKVAHEFAVMNSLRSTVDKLWNVSAYRFIDLLRKIHRKNCSGSDTFRKTSVSIAPDERGNVIVFPHHSLCVPLMESLYEFLSTNLESHPAICATVSYVAVIHAHPFSDGNGRTARTLYNTILRDHVPSAHFIPIRQISLMSRGGFLIRLRRAIYEADWDSIQEFFSSAMRLSDWAQCDNSLHG